MVERDLIRMRQQISALQKELREKEQELKNKQRSEDRRSVPLEEEKGAFDTYPISFMRECAGMDNE